MEAIFKKIINIFFWKLKGMDNVHKGYGKCGKYLEKSEKVGTLVYIQCKVITSVVFRFSSIFFISVSVKSMFKIGTSYILSVGRNIESWKAISHPVCLSIHLLVGLYIHTSVNLYHCVTHFWLRLFQDYCVSSKIHNSPWVPLSMTEFPYI